MLISTGCFGGSTSSDSNDSPTPTIVKPKPHVESVTATTTGSDSTYTAILQVKVKNDGAEGTILIQASITQNGKTEQNKTPVYDLKQGESREVTLKPFSLVWKGGDWTPNVQALVP